LPASGGSALSSRVSHLDTGRAPLSACPVPRPPDLRNQAIA
jgi:hypothetical protein